MKTSFKIFIAKYLSKILIYTLSNSPTITKRKKINWKLDLNEAIDLSIFLFGSFEPSIQKIVKNILKNETKNIDIIDIGANCGSHTLNFANENKFSRIFAIEPTKYGYDKLIENIELNPDLKKNIIPIQAFISSKNAIPNQVYSSWELNTDNQKHSEHKGIKKFTTNANIFSLDDFTEKYKIKESLIKCDVDGNELFVFESGANYLKKFKPKIVMELAPYLYKEYGYTAYDLLKIIKYYGYNFYDSNFKKISSIDEYIRKINKGSSKNIFLA